MASAQIGTEPQRVVPAVGFEPVERGGRIGGLPVQIAAMAGPGGLGYDPSPEVGIPSRRARPESEIVHTARRRFLIERSGGPLAIDGRPTKPTEAFRQRDPGRRARGVEMYGGTEGTERAVEMGLDFFARHQFPDGHWSLDRVARAASRTPRTPALGQMTSDTAATGLALLAFLGAGYTHLDDKHRDDGPPRARLAGRQPEARRRPVHRRRHRPYAWFYSHGIAAIALCEAYGMTRDPELREPAQQGDRVHRRQRSIPSRGGWRYADARRASRDRTRRSPAGS